LTRFIDARKHVDLLANGITFNRARARDLIEQYLGSSGCCAGGACLPSASHSSVGSGASFALPVVAPAPIGGNGAGDSHLAQDFFRKALAESLSQSDVFRITITSFLDAYNFDVRRLMKCCIHHVLPSGHVIPFCAYNVLYRDGHVPLPALRDAVTRASLLSPALP
jgi:hypothetical protein